MKTISVTKARQDLFQLINETVINSEPIQITAKQGNVVMISIDDWNALQETIYLNSVPNFIESIEEAENTPKSEWIPENEVEW